MPRNPQPKRSSKARVVVKVNPEGTVIQTGPDRYIAHEPMMEGMTWEEQVKKMKEKNPDGVIIDIDSILESNTPMQTFYEQMMEQYPDMPHRKLKRQADLIEKVVTRHRQQVFEAKMKVIEEKIRIQENIRLELQRQLDEKTREMEQLRQQQ